MSLFPALMPFATHQLYVGDGHVLYVEESGNPDGIPIVFIHGGPGGGSSPTSRRFFDPQRYRIVVFDQRGCGLSTPFASLEHNTTAHLVEDLERIRQHLGAERWALFGGSWGSTLALLYAQAHPERVLGLVLRGIFLCDQAALTWLYQDGAHQLFPDYWQDFIAPLNEVQRQDIIGSYYRLLTDPDLAVQQAAAQAWDLWEDRLSTLLPRDLPDYLDAQTAKAALAIARIECHFFKHLGFIQPQQILRDVPLIQHLPAWIVHGRYDVVCALSNAWALHQAWPGSELKIVPNAGHSANEPGIQQALVAATNALAQQLVGSNQ